MESPRHKRQLTVDIMLLAEFMLNICSQDVKSLIEETSFMANK